MCHNDTRTIFSHDLTDVDKCGPACCMWSGGLQSQEILCMPPSGWSNRLENVAQIVVLSHFRPENKTGARKCSKIADGAQLRHWAIS